MSQAEPEPSVRLAMNPSFTKVPSGLNTWMRSFTRSQTYSKRSTKDRRNARGYGTVGEAAHRVVVALVRVVGDVAVGAPVPFVFASIRVVDDHAVIAYPSATYTSFVCLSMNVLAGRRRFSKSLLPLLLLGLPICIRN